MIKQFGGKLTKALKERYAKSPHWRKGKFRNLEKTFMNIDVRHYPSLFRKQFIDRKGRVPKVKLPILPFNKNAFLEPSETAKFVWFGHSAVLIRLNGKTLFIDPMLGPTTTPFLPFGGNRFSENTLSIIDALPPIDVVLLSHDHYDHLDYDSIKKLLPKTGQFFVSLGTGRHLESWGIPETKIKEFDWWNNFEYEDISITFTPSRHFAGRGLTNRNKSLWGGWVFQTETENIYFSGDGGYGKHFKEIGKKFGPFDVGFMECGQYNKHWHLIHMYPEESIKAAIDAGVKIAVPVHWGAFELSLHTWKEPAEHFTKEADKAGLAFCTPNVGKLVPFGAFQSTKWWDFYS